MFHHRHTGVFRIAPLLAGLFLLPLAAQAVDLNDDGMDDVWQQRYGAELLAPDVDTDGDGHSNAKESAAGTNPQDGDSAFVLADALPATTTNTTLRWLSIIGKRYLPQISTNLAAWLDWEPSLDGTGADLEVVFPAADAARFYRVRVSDVDSDADGISDWAELQAGFDPSKAETTTGTPDLVALSAILTNPTTLRVDVIQGTAYERNLTNQPGLGWLRIVRTGGLAPVSAAYVTAGRSVQGADYVETFSGQAQFAFAQNQVDLILTPVADNVLEVPEYLTVSLQSGASYALGVTNSGAFRLLDDESGKEILFYTPLTAVPGTATAASGYGTLLLSGDHASARVSVSFSGLVAAQTAAHLHDHHTGNVLESLELGQILNHVWTFPTNGAGGLNTDQALLDAIVAHTIYVNVHSATYPKGEIEGEFVRTDGSITFTPPPPADPAPTYTDGALARDVQRFLAQATFGQTDALFTNVMTRGLAGWIDDQTNTNQVPQTRLLPFVLASDNWLIAQNAALPTPSTTYQPFFQSLIHAWWTMSRSAEDQLRQRVAFALSEILVVSIQNSTVRNRHYGTADYWDTLSRNAFGNFRTLLEDVTLHPIMANYLSMVQNEKFNAATGVSPDENYAREVMQLFSIGLVELHPDGSLRLDATNGLPLATYDNTDITELAKVFTGWAYSKTQTGGSASPTNWNNSGTISDNNNFGYRGGAAYAQAAYYHPFKVFAPQHETSAKTIVGDVQIPANQTGDEDLDDAMDALFNHPNTPAFIARRLIQRLVTSNPSRGYLYRVAQTFVDDGTGVRGNLGAVVRAILLDPEARTQSVAAQVGYGKLREPVLVMTQLLRAFNATSSIPASVINSASYTNPFPATASMLRFGNAASSLGQTPLNAPSVFNWWHPDYSVPGPVAAAGLDSPEFEIATESQVFNFANIFNLSLWNANGANTLAGFPAEVPPGYSPLEARIAPSTAAAQGALSGGGLSGLVDYLDG
ncbi:MAG: DUF1800 family protein, partial [Verrucomicrobia bacterium]|nr:DUF1800 family protein [Verrucomicrobiota bacterium]